MKKTTYRFNKGDDYHISQRHMIKLFDLCEVSNIDELKNVLDSEKLTSKTIESARKIRLQNELIIEQTRLTRLRANYFEAFGKEISESSFRTITHQNDSKYTAQQWDTIFAVLVETKGNVLEPQFLCVVCHRMEPTRPLMAVHLQQYHEKEMRFAIQ